MNKGHPYSHRVDARFADTDAEGHVYSGSYFVYCDEALMGLIAAAGYGWDVLALESRAFYYVESGCTISNRCALAKLCGLEPG